MSWRGVITMQPIKETQARNFARFMAGAGTLDILGIEYPRMQILSVGEILEGKRFQTPTVAGRHELEPRMPRVAEVIIMEKRVVRNPLAKWGRLRTWLAM